MRRRGYPSRLFRPSLILAVVLCLAGVARGQVPATRPAPADRVVALVGHGNGAGQFLAVVAPVAKSSGPPQPATEIRYRPLGSGPDAWVRYAALDARVLALGERAGDLAVLVELAQSGPGRTQVRYVYNGLTTADGGGGQGGPAGPQNVPGPGLPAEVVAFDLAGGVGGAPLATLVRGEQGDDKGDAAVWTLVGDQWKPLAALPPDVAALPDPALSLGFAGVRPVVAARVGPNALRVLALADDATTTQPNARWRAAGDLELRDGERFRVVDAAAVGEVALVYVWGATDRLVRLDVRPDGAGPESAEVTFPLPPETRATAATGDPRAAAVALGAVRIDRAVDVADEPQALYEVALDPRTLLPMNDAPARLELRSSTPAEVRHKLGLVVLYALLVVAVVTVLRQKPPPPADKLRDVARHLAPPSLRLAAGLVDALPLAVTLGFWQVARGRLPEAALWVVAGVGVTVYFCHLIAAELATGRSLGKAMFGLRVVKTDGSAAGVWPVLLRNLLRPLDAFTGGLTLVLALLTPLRQRLGDMAAATTVVRSRPDDADAPDDGEDAPPEP